jgi:hypothetical protein
MAINWKNKLKSQKSRTDHQCRLLKLSIILVFAISGSSSNKCKSIDGMTIPESIIIKLKNKNTVLSDKVNFEDNNYELRLKADSSFHVFKNGNNIYLVSTCCDGTQTICICDKEYCPNIFKTWFRFYKEDDFGYFNVKDAKQFYKGKAKYANILNSKYFISKKGIKLGMNPEEVINIYGEPDEKEIIGRNPKIVRFKWFVYGKGEAADLKKETNKIIYDKQICTNIFYGADYYVDFVINNDQEAAVLIYISQHNP